MMTDYDNETAYDKEKPIMWIHLFLYYMQCLYRANKVNISCLILYMHTLDCGM